MRDIDEPLNELPGNRKISAWDIFGKKHTRNLKDFKFRVSVYGVLVEGNGLLLKRDPRVTQFSLPGGGVKIGEKLQKALIREFKEETGLDIRVSELYDVRDNMFTLNGEDAHAILIYFKVSKAGGYLKGNGDDSVDVTFRNITELGKKDIMPVDWQTIQKLKKEIIN